MPLTAADLIVRTAENWATANTFAALTELADIVKFRMDSAVWDNATVDLQVKAVAMAYEDISKLAWSTFVGVSQQRDYEFGERFGSINQPPVDDPEFMVRVKKAQAAQAVYILNGTQIRDMAREGVKWTRQLTGADIEVTGYLGPVCAEAKELLGPYVELMPRMRRFGVGPTRR